MFRSTTFLIITLLTITACKTDKKPQLKNQTIELEVHPIDSVIENQNELDAVELRKNDLKIAPIKNGADDTKIIETYLQHKQYYNETSVSIVDFCYPYLDEQYNPKFEIFNTYINTNLLKFPEIEKNSHKNHELLCDTITNTPNRTHRIAEYKVFSQSQNHLSILFYLENHYAHTKTAYYTFETINFDLANGQLLNFKNYFNKGSIEDVLSVINSEINSAIQNGDLFYECFEVSLDDFLIAKNNFVINDNSMIFYFNDCVMCPAFVGSYNIEISLEKLKPFLKKNGHNNLNIN